MVEVVDSCDRLDEVVDLYTECVQHACDTAIPRKRSVRRLKLPWWSPELERLKKDANTKKRRIRNAAPSRRRFVVEEYVRAKEVYERAAADAQTTSWKRFCTAQDRESTWDGVYRVIRDTGKNREDVLLINDSGQTCSPNESAVFLMNTFFPDDRVDADDPYHTEAFNPKKGPGIDGFTSDICQAAILRDLGLFLAMANKYFQLGYFPRAWKVAAIKMILKPGKDEYSVRSLIVP
ncbi:Retrovirus-related Pol polyprotein from type-1 retrotransposable element R1 [Eumeta japonica]|uniref:Retrovirus-related Pol polyprotein from type-1 retrotransposable element R1 n=1 Tax=Eumeta variegata TaxID=151549 RepID=A0A4C1XS27_EUMVA|nr:Retrovirus-related Pol polyprotein from type-1 retrotransposable element R1 [Eumeta japonica]